MTALGPDPNYWPPRWREAYMERESIMAEAGVADSAAKAEADVRRQAEGEGQQAIFADMANMRRVGR